MAIKLANIPVLPGIFNAVITISVLSVANSCTFGSTRTMQALATRGMGPKFLAYVDKHGRPIWCVLIQLLFGVLAYTIDAGYTSAENFFDWLLALSGVGQFFIWGSICAAHIRFRMAWKYHNHNLDEIPFRAVGGIWGSAIGLGLNIIFFMAAFYTAVASAIEAHTGTGKASAGVRTWFEDMLAAPVILALYVFWKIWSKESYIFTPLNSIDLDYGTRTNLQDLQDAAARQRKEHAAKSFPMRVLNYLV